MIEELIHRIGGRVMMAKEIKMLENIKLICPVLFFDEMEFITIFSDQTFCH